jgi:hypothetical protein
MTQADLDRQISRRTGESLSTIRGMGFGPLLPIPYECDARPQAVDWDDVDAQRVGMFPGQRRRPR